MTETLKRYGPVAALAGVGVGAATGLVALDLPPWAVDMLKQWGPAGVLFMGFAWYVPRGTIPAFVKAQQGQVVALEKISDAMEKVAGQESRLEQLMNESLINDRVMVNRMNRLEELILGSKISE